MIGIGIDSSQQKSQYLDMINVSRNTTSRNTEGDRPLGEAWLRVGAIIAEFNMGGYGVAR